jgi:hypothetical protein
MARRKGQPRIAWKVRACGCGRMYVGHADQERCTKCSGPHKPYAAELGWRSLASFCGECKHVPDCVLHKAWEKQGVIGKVAGCPLVEEQRVSDQSRPVPLLRPSVDELSQLGLMWWER